MRAAVINSAASVGMTLVPNQALSTLFNPTMTTQIQWQRAMLRCMTR